MVTNRVGPPVTGDDFFNRETEQRRIWDYLERESLLLLAPRRVGKTSLMYRLREAAAEHGFEATYLSVADAQDEVSFVRRLFAEVEQLEPARAVLKKLSKGPLAGVVRRVKKLGLFGVSIELGDAAEDRWAELAEALTVALAKQGERWLLLVDELPVFVLNLLKLDPSGARARHFLNWFRTLRQQTDVGERIRWLLAGSIGLDTVASRLAVGDAINDLRLVHLGAFSVSDAEELVRQLAETYRLELAQDVRREMVRRVGWTIPYYLQLLFSELRELCEDGQTPTAEHVGEATESLLAKKAYFDYWRQRLGEELGRPDSGFAVALLNVIAVDDTGVSRGTLEHALAEHVQDENARAEKLRFLLDVLEGDGYLVVKNDGRYVFRSPLLREFWVRRVAP